MLVREATVLCATQVHQQYRSSVSPPTLILEYKAPKHIALYVTTQSLRTGVLTVSKSKKCTAGYLLTSYTQSESRPLAKCSVITILILIQY